MKIFTNLKNSMYQTKAHRILSFHEVFKLQKQCASFSMFFDVNRGEPEIYENGLTCVSEEGEKIGSITSKNTYYFFLGNTCIIYNKSDYGRIIRIIVKSPEDKWEVHRDFGRDDLCHVKIDTKYVEVYVWWDVDWLGCGKSNCDWVSKKGYWWRTIYNDVCEIYETVDKKNSDYLFGRIYLEYEKNQKI